MKTFELSKKGSYSGRGGGTSSIRQLEREINELMDKEVVMWGQRLCIMWLNDGD